MDESGIRHRFAVHYLASRPTRHPEAMDRLLSWCAVFDREGLAPIEGDASAGNLSFRAGDGFVITPSRCRLKTGLEWENLVEVVFADPDSFRLDVRGSAPPSSDSFLHERIYAARPDVQAVFHGHDARILAHAAALARSFPIALTTKSRPFGTLEDANDTAKELGDRRFIIRLGHGFVAAAPSMDEAGTLSLQMHEHATSRE